MLCVFLLVRGLGTVLHAGEVKASIHWHGDQGTVRAFEMQLCDDIVDQCSL